MVTGIEYALMAGHAYRTTRDEINWIPAPQGWSPFFPVPVPDPATTSFPISGGFEAVSFQRGNEIVISFAGTDFADFTGDWLEANIPLAFGFSSDQLRQAALYYLQVKDANPGATISFTGHSLGGGLAALMGVFFDRPAVTFDQAHFAAAASIAVRDDLISYLNTKVYTTPSLMAFVPELFSFDPYGAPSASRAYRVSGFFVQDEILQYPPFSPPFNTLGTQTPLPHGSIDLGLTGPISLHSQALLSAFLQNDDFRAITFKLPELMEMVFDEALYAYKTTADNTKFANLLEHLLRHQVGVRDSETGDTTVAADAMLDRFTSDLLKVAQDGGFTLTNTRITRTLVAFAMQMYYENPQAADPNKALFTDVTGGIRFDRTDVAANLNDAKGWQMYFQNYLNTLTLEEPRIVLQLLPAATDWFIQAGSVSMSATADHEWRFAA